MPKGEWTFVTSHGAVLALTAQYGQITAREIAGILGMTERPVRRIIAELDAAGYLVKTRVGTLNHYEVNHHLPLRMPSARDVVVGQLLQVLEFSPPEGPASFDGQVVVDKPLDPFDRRKGASPYPDAP